MAKKGLHFNHHRSCFVTTLQKNNTPKAIKKRTRIVMAALVPREPASALLSLYIYWCYTALFTLNYSNKLIIDAHCDDDVRAKLQRRIRVVVECRPDGRSGGEKNVKMSESLSFSRSSRKIQETKWAISKNAFPKMALLSWRGMFVCRADLVGIRS
jgi:hypothetical protein